MEEMYLILPIFASDGQESFESNLHIIPTVDPLGFIIEERRNKKRVEKATGQLCSCNLEFLGVNEHGRRYGPVLSE